MGMRRERFARTGVVVLVAALVVLSVLPGLAAADSRVGGTVVVAEGETVDGLSAVSGTVVVRGTVDGTLEAVGGTVVVAESGTVTGDVSVSGGSVQIDGTVGGDVAAAAGAFTLGETGVVEGSLDVGAGTVLVDGTVRGDATVGAERLVLGSTAVVGGDLTVDDETELVRDEGATVSGAVVRSDVGGFEPVVFRGVDAVFTAWGFVANLLLGALLLLAFPRFSERVAQAVAERPGRTGGAGLVTFVGVPLVLVVLVLSIVGIPIALFLGVPVVVVGGWVAIVYGRFAVAAWALRELGYENRWAALVAGVVGLGLVGLIPVLGGLVDLVVFLLGLGAVALGLYELRIGGRESPPGTEQPASGGESPQPA